MTQLFVLLLSTQMLFGQVAEARPESSIPPKIDAFLKLCETSRKGAIEQLEHSLRGLESQQLKSPETSSRMAKIQADLRALRQNTAPVVPQLHFPPEVGAIGRLPRLNCHVEQILSSTEMLASCYFPVRVTTVKHFQSIGETIYRPARFLIRGIPTGSMHEGADVELTEVFEISGAQRYRTTGGTATSVLLLTQFDMKQIEPYFRASRERK